MLELREALIILDDKMKMVAAPTVDLMIKAYNGCEGDIEMLEVVVSDAMDLRITLVNDMVSRKGGFQLTPVEWGIVVNDALKQSLEGHLGVAIVDDERVEFVDMNDRFD